MEKVDDGKVKLTVVGKGDNNQYLECRVDVPGKISNRKVSKRLYISTCSILFEDVFPNLTACLLRGSTPQIVFWTLVP